MDKKSAEHFAIALALACVRNGFIEELHCGKGAYSQAGDYSDVKAVTPDREIPWRELSRISDEEMKRLMKEIVNKLYTVLLNLEDEDFMAAFLSWGARYTQEWDKPEELADFVLRKPSRRHIGYATPA
jgi:hypothetical protein